MKCNRGVSLSGGQKARYDANCFLIFVFLTIISRVALARAVYAPAKYVLLDDPLSAVVCQFRERARTAPDNRRNRTVTLHGPYLRTSFVGPFWPIALWYAFFIIRAIDIK